MCSQNLEFQRTTTPISIVKGMHHYHIVEHDCDIIAVTETWLPCEDLLANQIIGDVCPEGYKMSHIPHGTGHRGGGIGILYKTCLDIPVADNCQLTTVKYNTFLIILLNMLNIS